MGGGRGEGKQLVAVAVFSSVSVAELVAFNLVMTLRFCPWLVRKRTRKLYSPKEDER